MDFDDLGQLIVSIILIAIVAIPTLIGIGYFIHIGWNLGF